MRNMFIVACLVIGLLVAFPMGWADAFDTAKIKGSISFTSFEPLDPSDYGFWIIYSTTSGIRGKSRIEAISIEINSDGTFEVPPIKFGRTGYMRFYPAMPASGMLSRMRDKKLPESKNIRFVLVKRAELVPDKTDRAVESFYMNIYDFDFPWNIGVLGWLDIQMDSCEDNLCGPDFLKSVLENLHAQEISFEMIPKNERVERLFTALNPENSTICLGIRGTLGAFWVDSWRPDRTFFSFYTPENNTSEVWGKVDFKVDRKNLELLSPQPKFISPWRDILHSESNAHSNLTFFREDTAAFEWSLEIERTTINWSEYRFTAPLLLDTSLGFEKVDVDNALFN